MIFTPPAALSLAPSRSAYRTIDPETVCSASMLLLPRREGSASVPANFGAADGAATWFLCNYGSLYWLLFGNCGRLQMSGCGPGKPFSTIATSHAARRIASTTRSIPIDRDPFTSTALPFRIAGWTNGIVSSAKRQATIFASGIPD